MSKTRDDQDRFLVKKKKQLDELTQERDSLQIDLNEKLDQVNSASNETYAKYIGKLKHLCTLFLQEEPGQEESDELKREVKRLEGELAASKAEFEAL